MIDPVLSRREVLAAASAGIALSVLGGCATDSTDKPKVITTGSVDIGPAANYPAGTVNQQYLAQYGFVVVNESGPVVAVRPICTHKGCLTKWKPEINQFECPCHESRFNMLGQVTQGPAKASMRAIAAAPTAEGTLVVSLDKLNGAG